MVPKSPQFRRFRVWFGSLVFVGPVLAGNLALHTFTPPPTGNDVVWPASVLDGAILSPGGGFAGRVGLSNWSNNPLFFDDHYVATGNAGGIDGDALWGNPRSGFPLDDPGFSIDLQDFFIEDSETGELTEQVSAVSFDFAWASSFAGASLGVLELEIEDYGGDTEVVWVPLGTTFPHGIGGTGQGRSGKVTLTPQAVSNIYRIHFYNLAEIDPGGHIGEFAIDNLSVSGTGGGGEPAELSAVDWQGDPISGYGTNSLTGTGAFGISFDLFNGGGSSATVTVHWTPSSPALYQPQAFNQVTVLPGATLHGAFGWETNTNTTPSGSYAGTFGVTTVENPGPPDTLLELLEFKLYDPPLLTDNTGAPVVAPLGQVSLSNAVAGPHPGALRASVDVGTLQFSNPRFSLSGILPGARLDAGASLTGTVAFDAAGAPSGVHTGTLRMPLVMKSPDGYLNDAQPVADRLWTLSATVAPKPVASESVAAGGGLAGAGLDVSGAGGGAALVGGLSPSNQTIGLAVEAAPPAANPGGVGPAVALDFGVASGLYVLQLSYDTSPPGFAEQDLRVFAWNAPGSQWVPAISLNGNGGTTVAGAAPFAGSYAAFLAGPGGGTLDAADLGAFGVDPVANSVWVVLDYEGLFQLSAAGGSLPPQILAISRNPATNTTTISYQSVAGESFVVHGGTSPDALAPLGSTATGTGAVMNYIHVPAGSPPSFFYQMSRP